MFFFDVANVVESVLLGIHGGVISATSRPAVSILAKLRRTSASSRILASFAYAAVDICICSCFARSAGFRYVESFTVLLSGVIRFCSFLSGEVVGDVILGVCESLRCFKRRALVLLLASAWAPCCRFCRSRHLVERAAVAALGIRVSAVDRVEERFLG